MKEIKIKISEENKEILGEGKIEGNLYYLPNVKLSREKYLEINKVLELCGGKWNRTKKAHVFESEEKANQIIKAKEEGSIIDKKKTYQFFETPSEIADQMLELLNIKYTDDPVKMQDVLEPSAGLGAIADKIDSSRCLFRCGEIDPEKAEILISKGYPVYIGDFLTGISEKLDKIIMNPPFTKGQDADHVLHAYSLLRKNGRLVSIMSAGVEFNQQKKYQKVRELIEKNGEIIKLPENTFKESGTNVNTVIVVINKI